MYLILFFVVIILISFIISFYNIREKRKLIKEINTDNLTGLGSRRKLMIDLDKFIKLRKPFTMAFIDIDGLKLVNDVLGHEAGNFVLKSFAYLLKNNFINSYRIGGDEFIILVEDSTNFEKILQEICSIKTKKCKFYDGQINFSVGLSAYPNDATSKEALMEIADSKMYQCKNQKTNRN